MTRHGKDKCHLPQAQLLTPLLVRKRLQELATDKAPQKVHSAATKAQIKKVEEKWVEYVFSNKLLDRYLLTLVRYCDTISEDPWIVLKRCSPQYSNISLNKLWILSQFPIIQLLKSCRNIYNWFTKSNMATLYMKLLDWKLIMYVAHTKW